MEPRAEAREDDDGKTVSVSPNPVCSPMLQSGESPSPTNDTILKGVDADANAGVGTGDEDK